MRNVNNPDPASTAADKPQSPGGIRSQLIDNVGVRLEAYLGGTQMTVGELSALAAGAVVPLDAPLNQAVELRLNGVCVGKGELVSVGDKFAIRLLEISR